ncbi:hypothetical protein GCM10028822_03440 [Hymenobacter terrigena]
MTLVVSWIAYDSRGPSSIYLLSDSRISWRNGSSFDYARKVFGCVNYPDIFAYSGDVLFPSIVLNQIVNIIDSGMLFNEAWDFEEKFNAFYNKIKQVFQQYPSQVKDIVNDSIQIIHASRISDKNFFCRKIRWLKTTGQWTVENSDFKGYSEKIFVIGSGDEEFLDRYLRYNIGDGKVSRAVFHCFYEFLINTKNKTCGGAPQLVGLYRNLSARSFGLIHNEKRYFQGLESNDLTDFNGVEWRNELFENCDGQTMTIKSNAKRQPNPLLR